MDESITGDSDNGRTGTGDGAFVRPDVTCVVPDGIHTTVCMQCPWGCGMKVQIEGGQIAKISGNKAHPFSTGLLCPKAFAAPDVMHHPARITTPMRRTADGWQVIGWDDAYGILVEQLSRLKERYGPRALAVAIGMPVLLGGNSTVSFLRRFCDIYGTPNCFSVESICFRCQIIARILTLGTYEVPDVTNTACVVVWGNNPDASAPPAAKTHPRGAGQGRQAHRHRSPRHRARRRAPTSTCRCAPAPTPPWRWA